MLIGCGNYASKSHLPAIKSFQGWYPGSVRLKYVVELPGNAARVTESLRNTGHDPKDISILVSDGQLPSDIDACIVATDSIHHFGYIKWALENGKMTLADKPLTFRGGGQ